jgi:hypothetical protein
MSSSLLLHEENRHVPEFVYKLLDVFPVLHLTLVLSLLGLQFLHHSVVEFSIVA